MNNSKLVVDSVRLSLEEPVSHLPELRQREGELTKIIDAIQGIRKTKEWSTLTSQVFAGLTESLNKNILTEGRKDNPDTNKLNRLSGELKWAEQYSDLTKLEARFRLELTNVRTQLYGKTKENTGGSR